MAYFKRTNIFKSILFSRGTALVVIFLIVFVGFALFSIVGKSMSASSARKLAESQATELKQKDDDMTRKLTALGTADGEEAALREQFPVVRPGEHVVVITDESQSATAIQALSPQGSQKGFWNFLKGIFSKKS
jgi:DNA-binding NarL/FixJ family response regulator